MGHGTFKGGSCRVYHITWRRRHILLLLTFGGMAKPPPKSAPKPSSAPPPSVEAVSEDQLFYNLAMAIMVLGAELKDDRCAAVCCDNLRRAVCWLAALLAALLTVLLNRSPSLHV